MPIFSLNVKQCAREGKIYWVDAAMSDDTLMLDIQTVELTDLTSSRLPVEEAIPIFPAIRCACSGNHYPAVTEKKW